MEEKKQITIHLPKALPYHTTDPSLHQTIRQRRAILRDSDGEDPPADAYFQSYIS